MNAEKKKNTRRKRQRRVSGMIMEGKKGSVWVGGKKKGANFWSQINIRERGKENVNE